MAIPGPSTRCSSELMVSSVIYTGPSTRMEM